MILVGSLTLLEHTPPPPNKTMEEISSKDGSRRFLSFLFDFFFMI